MQQPRIIQLSSAAFASALALAGCAAPSAGSEPRGLAGETDSAARLSLGATEAQAREGGTSLFTLESTPDLVLHATLRDSKYEGETLQILGTDPHGAVVWSYPHLQKGRSFDAVLPVFGSTAARTHTIGSYSFEVRAPDRTVIAAGRATFTSTRGTPHAGGGAFDGVSSPTATDAVLAALGE